MSGIRVVVCSVLAGFVLGAAEAAAQSCVVDVEWLNRNRHVFGSVNTECGICLSVGRLNVTHTPPWGNWGVESRHSEDAVNGTQFKGWKAGLATTPACAEAHEDISGDRPEWNSCTDGEEYRPPNPAFYNHEGDTQQFSADVQSYAKATVSLQASCPVDQDGDGRFDVGGCSALNRGVFFSESMSVRELDPVTWDSTVTNLSFPTLTAAPSCDVSGCTQGESRWEVSYANDTASAEVKLIVLGARWEDPEGVCPAVSGQ